MPDARGDGAGDGATVARWNCPRDWVALAQGGCGPAHRACANGQAAAGACDTVPWNRAHDVATDGGAIAAMYAAPDGGVGGRWAESPGGAIVPARDGSPIAGPPSCPPGWTTGPMNACTSRVGTTTCGAGAVPLPDGTCTATADSDCPTTEYADVGAEAVGAVVVHAREGADPAMADGSIARPYATITAALGGAGVNGWVLVAAGTYPEAVAFTSSAHVVGVCAARVRVTGATGATAVTVGRAGITVDLRGVRIVSGDVALVVLAGATATLRRVGVEGAVGQGIVSFGASAVLTLEDVAIERTAELGAAMGQAALYVANRGRLTARCLAVRRSARDAVVVEGGASATIDDSAITQTLGPVTLSQYGLRVGVNSTVTLNRVVIVESEGFAVSTSGSGSVRATDLILRDTRLANSASFCMVIYAPAFGSFRGTRVTIDGFPERGAMATGTNATVELTDSVVRGGRSVSRTAFTQGVTAYDGGRVVLTRSIVEDTDGYGVITHGARAHAELTDVIVRDIHLDMRPANGLGLSAQSNATINATRCVIERCANHALTSLSGGSSLVLADSVVRDSNGMGAYVSAGSRLSILRSRLVSNRFAGVASNGIGSAMTVTDSVIENTRAPDGRVTGYGANANAAGHVTLERTAVVANHTSGVVATGANAIADLRHVWIADTQANMVTPGILSGGRGIEASAGGRVSAEQVLLSGNREAGVTSFGAGSSVDLSDGWIASVLPRTNGPGLGCAVFGIATMRLARVGVVDISGAAIATLAGPAGEMPGQLTVEDIFVDGVRTAPIEDGNPIAQAYGLLASAGIPIDASRAVLRNGGYGFFVDSSRLSLRDAWITGQLDAAGARWSVGSMDVQLDRVVAAQNADDDLERSRQLPRGAALAPPTSVCAVAQCL